VYVKDVVRALIGEDDGTVASGEAISINDLIALLGKKTGQLSVRYVDAIQGETRSGAVHVDLPISVGLDEGLDLTVDWFRGTAR
jgi:hypothetical protein